MAFHKQPFPVAPGTLLQAGRETGAGAELLAFRAGEENPVKLSGCLVGRDQEVAEGNRVVGGRMKWAARGC